MSNLGLKKYNLLYHNIVDIVSFFQGNWGISYYTLSETIYPGNKNLSSDEKKVVDKLWDDYLKTGRNDFILYFQLPENARKRLFDSNQKEYKKEGYELDVTFEFFDQELAQKLFQFEQNMRKDARLVLSKIFNEEFTEEQKEELDLGKWIENYGKATHCYRKWIDYQRKGYMLIKQENTFRSYFVNYIFYNQI